MQMAKCKLEEWASAERGARSEERSERTGADGRHLDIHGEHECGAATKDNGFASQALGKVCDARDSPPC